MIYLDVILDLFLLRWNYINNTNSYVFSIHKTRTHTFLFHFVVIRKIDPFIYIVIPNDNKEADLNDELTLKDLRANELWTITTSDWCTLNAKLFM